MPNKRNKTYDLLRQKLENAELFIGLVFMILELLQLIFQLCDRLRLLNAY